MWFDQTGLPWIMPSPGMPTLDTATVYPGFCNFEGTNISEGRGTTKPFEIFGAPFIDAYALADELNREGLTGITFRPTYFIPTSSKHSGKSCSGVQGHVTDRKAFQPVVAGVKTIEVIHRMYPNDFAFREAGPSGHTHFDLLLGSDAERLAISAGKTTEEITSTWTAGLEEFNNRRQGYLLYE
jgi:beta-N-acetylhexosaminidase